MVATPLGGAGLSFFQSADFGVLDERAAIVEVAPKLDTLTLHYSTDLKQLQFIAKNGNGDYSIIFSDPACSYSGFDTSVITVDANGYVTAIKDGETVIRAAYKKFDMEIKVIVDMAR